MGGCVQGGWVGGVGPPPTPHPPDPPSGAELLKRALALALALDGLNIVWLPLGHIQWAPAVGFRRPPAVLGALSRQSIAQVLTDARWAGRV